MSFKRVIETYGYPVVSKEVAKRVHEAKRNPKGFGAISLGLYTPDADCKIKAPTKGGPYDYTKHAYLVNAPFKIHSICCDIMKKKPAYMYGKATGMYPIIATMAEESLQRQSTWIQQGCNAFDSKHPKSAPMSFWTEQDVLQYIKLKNLPIASVYGRIEADTRREREREREREITHYWMFKNWLRILPLWSPSGQTSKPYSAIGTYTPKTA